MNQIIKPFLLLTHCFLALNCVKVEKCGLWNQISKCFRVSGNNTHCYETKPNGTYCCTDTLIFNDFFTDDNSEINFEKCVSYSENEHNIFLLKLFVLSIGLLICIFISMIICYCHTHNFACGKQQDGLVVLAVKDTQMSSKLSVPGPSAKSSRSPSVVSIICVNVMDTSFNLETPSGAIATTRRPSLRSNSSFNQKDSTPIGRFSPIFLK